MAGLGPIAFTVAVVRRLRDERLFDTAGNLTYATLLALVPAVAVAFSVASYSPMFDRAVDAAQAYLIANMLPDAPGVEKLQAQIVGFAEQAGKLTAAGLAVFAAAAVFLMLALDTAMNRIFRSPQSRSLLRNLLVYTVLLISGPVLLGASVLLASYAVVASFGLLDLQGYARTVVGALPFVLTCTALTLLYGVVPAVPVRVRHAVMGGVLAGAVFELTRRGFTYYLAQVVPTYQLVYGALAALPVFLVWLYVCWLLVLAGAAVTALLSSRP